MISDEMFKKLCELELIPTFRKPTFEELWAICGLNNHKSGQSLSDLAAEMLIELKNRGMM
jgi:hypothetical protein